jgi:hypothetical protein
MRASSLFSWYAHKHDPSYAMHAPVVNTLRNLGYEEATDMAGARFVFPSWDDARAIVHTASLSPYAHVSVLQNELLLLDIPSYHDMLRRAGDDAAVRVYSRYAPGRLTGTFLQRPAFGGLESPATRVVTNPIDWYHPASVLVPMPTSPLRFRDTLVVLRGAILILGSGRCFLSSAAEALMFPVNAPLSRPRSVGSAADLGLAARDVFYTTVQNALRAYFAEAGAEVQPGKQFRILQVTMIPGQQKESVVPTWVDFHVLRIGAAGMNDIQKTQVEELVACLMNPEVGRYTLEINLR